MTKLFIVIELCELEEFSKVLIWVFLELTRHGRLMYAIGSNERAAALAGTDVNRYKIVAYMISGVMASTTCRGP